MAAQGLADALAGAFGAGPNRPALNAFVASSQANNALRSAQTEDALTKATIAQQQQTAREGVGPAYAQMVGPDGKPADPAMVGLADAFSRSGANLDTLGTGLTGMLQSVGHNTLLRPENIGTRADTAAEAGISGKAPLLTQEVKDNFVPTPGAPATPAIQQTPEGAAKTANQNAQAGYHLTQGGAAAQDPEAIRLAAYMLYKTGQMPTLGMGASSTRLAVLHGAHNFAMQEEESGQPVVIPGYEAMLQHGQDFKGGQRAINALASGPMATGVRAADNAFGHLNLYKEVFQGLQNHDIQVFNKFGNMFQEATGKPIPATVEALGQMIGPELTKMMTQTGAGSAEERMAFPTHIAGLQKSPEQVGSVVDYIQQIINRQLQGFEQDYAGSTHRGDFAERYLLPDTRASYSAYNAAHGGPTVPNGVAPIARPGAPPVAPPVVDPLGIR